MKPIMEVNELWISIVRPPRLPAYVRLLRPVQMLWTLRQIFRVLRVTVCWP
jgi:hypothetical protein